MVVYLTADEVIRLHDLETDAPVRDRNMLDGAVGRPQQTFDGETLHVTIHDKAAALFHALAHDHAFLDGNKRAAVICAEVFYALNGYGFHPDDDELMHVAIDAAIGSLDVGKIAARFSMWADPIPDELLPDDIA